ncbi:MAG: proline--tRNA ligase [Alphaproteobacteria bacterium]|nr:proline--tRNA ligase [Alphaproteobacteria bacterium]
MAKPQKTAITPTRAENYPDWYQQVIKGADMAENSPVRGCMVIKPWGYAIWERIQGALDRRFKATGHENAYFPLLIPLRFIEKEAAHVEGFAKEMAVVTHHRLVEKDGRLVPDAPLEEPLIIRPTSETIIGEAFSNWIRSYRDLPVLINQWANVMRWEMRPRLFLRTSEFLWQEGHTAHADEADARAETMRMLEVYREVAEDVLAMPVICGEKPEFERFPGAVNTYCIEAMMQDGKALQAGTSHYLGQNFARAANIRFQTEAGDWAHCHTTSWGVSTRLIGALIMTHADDDGLRLPPALAPAQVIVLPILRSEEDKAAVMPFAEELARAIGSQIFNGEPIRVKLDTRDYPAPEKRWEWVRKGAPVILEVGPRDIENRTAAMARRDRMGEKKAILPDSEIVMRMGGYLAEIQGTLLAEARTFAKARTRTDIRDRQSFEAFFAGEAEDSFSSDLGFVRAPWCGESSTEAMLKALKVTIRCLPFDQPARLGPCVLTGKPATAEAIFAKAY